MNGSPMQLGQIPHPLSHTVASYRTYSYHGFKKDQLFNLLNESINERKLDLTILTALEILLSGWLNLLWKHVWLVYINLVNVTVIGGFEYLTSTQKMLNGHKKRYGLSVLEMGQDQLVRNTMVEILTWLCLQRRIKLDRVGETHTYTPSQFALSEWSEIDKTNQLPKDVKVCMTQIIEAVANKKHAHTLHWISLLTQDQSDMLVPIWDYFLLEADADDRSLIKLLRDKSKGTASIMPALYGTILLIYFRNKLDTSLNIHASMMNPHIVKAVVRCNLMVDKIKATLGTRLVARSKPSSSSKGTAQTSKARWELDTATNVMEVLRKSDGRRRKLPKRKLGGRKKC